MMAYIYYPGSRFAEPPPPPKWYLPCHSLTLPKPNVCDCAHFLHMRAPKPSSVTRIASQRRPIRVRVQMFPARFTREAAKAVNCHEDRVPDMSDPCDCGHLAKKDHLDMRALNKATVTIPDRPDPF